MEKQVATNLLVCFLLAMCNGQLSAKTVEIIGGKDAILGEFPWQISLQYFNGSQNVHFCSGSLINKNWVLTAAHCLLGGPSSLHLGAIGMEAVAGITNTAGQQASEQRIQVESYFAHRSYNPATVENDIALLNLTEAFVLGEFVGVVGLPTMRQQSSGSALVAGWGAITPGDDYSTKLQWEQVDIISDGECQQLIAGHDIFESMICTYNNGNGPCDGDSGSAMVSKVNGTSTFYQSGIVSWGVQCGDPNYPTVFTEVSYFIDWINTTIHCLADC